MAIAACYSLHAAIAKAEQTEKKVKSRCFAMQHILAQLLKWLMLITITIGMCLMNGYSDYKVQTLSIKRQTGEGVTPSPVCSVISKKCSQKSKIISEIFSQLFYRKVNAEFHSPFGASLHFCNPLIGISTEVIQQNPAALNVRELANDGM